MEVKLEEERAMLKIMIGSTGVGGSLLVMGQQDPMNSYLQFGALGILALCALWLVTKIVPAAMHQRQEEMKGMLNTLINEREKLIAAMQRLADDHATEMKEARLETQKLVQGITEASLEERKEWARLTREGIEIQSRTQIALTDIINILRRIKSTEKDAGE